MLYLLTVFCILCWFLDFLFLTLSCLGVGGRFICYSCMHACATAITLIAIKLPDVARLSANPLRTRTRRRRPTPRCLALKPVWSCREEVYVWLTKGASHCSSFTSWVTLYFSAYPFVMSTFLILFYMFLFFINNYSFVVYDVPVVLIAQLWLKWRKFCTNVYMSYHYAIIMLSL